MTHILNNDISIECITTHIIHSQIGCTVNMSTVEFVIALCSIQFGSLNMSTSRKNYLCDKLCVCSESSYSVHSGKSMTNKRESQNHNWPTTGEVKFMKQRNVLLWTIKETKKC